MTNQPEDRPSIIAYLVRHPDANGPADLARAVFRELRADPDVPARRGLGVPVRFRTSQSADTAPSPIPFAAAERTAAFVRADVSRG